ncbi:MAG: ribonuclease H-like domain-containing protein [Nitrososphaera sp.]
MAPGCHYWIYFDIETTGIDPEIDRIITIQYQTLAYDQEGRRQVWNYNGKPSSTLTILKEWESNEKTILEEAYKALEFSNPRYRHWFEPIGNLLSFEGKFLKARMRKNGIVTDTDHIQFGQFNVMDLRPLMILINKGDYTTAQFFGKTGKNKMVPVWYERKEYDKILEYVQEEAADFAKTLDYLVLNLPKHREDILALHT